MSLDGRLSAEGTDVFGVLSDLHLLNLLSKGGTVSENQGNKLSAIHSDLLLTLMRVVQKLMALQGEETAKCRVERPCRYSSALERVNHVPCTVFAGNSDLLGSLRHLG